MASDQQPRPNAQMNVQKEGAHPRDMSQYIRTYAKDVAKLTGQPVPAASVPPKKASESDDSSGVMLPEFDPSPVQRDDGQVSSKEFPQEVLTVSREDSKNLFEHVPTMPPASVEPPAPVPIPQVEEAEREAILERLRQKVALQQQQSVPPPSPPPPPPPPPPPVAPVELPPEKTSPLHTYTSDFADRIDEKRASTFSVLAAEQDAQTGTRPNTQAKSRSAVPIMLAVLLILLGVGGLGAAFYLIDQGEPQETLGVPSLVFADEKIELEGPDYRQALADVAAQPLVEGNVLITYVTNATTTKLGIRKEPQPGGVLMRLLELGAPDILLRNVDISSTVGIIAAGGETRPFFLMRVNSFERTFAGMLGWEPRMPENLALFYPESAAIVDALATTTPTSGTPIPHTPASPSVQFVDAVVANRDVRILRDQSGRSLMLYGYADKQTLIITRNEAAFTALTARLTAGAGN